MKSQMASPGFTDAFAALVAVVNTKFPKVGNLEGLFYSSRELISGMTRYSHTPLGSDFLVHKHLVAYLYF